MAQANVVSITGKPQRKRHADDALLSLLATWKLARAKLRFEYAKADYESRFYSRDEEYNCEINDAFTQVSQASDHFADWKPKSTLGCQVMIDSVIDILLEGQRNPDSPLAAGPVIEMLLSVSGALALKDIKIKS